MRRAAALLALALIAAAPPPADVAASADEPRAAGNQKPVWEVATVAPDATDVAKSTYVVQPGDTLSAMVRKTGAGADVIAHENDLAPPFTLRPGAKLTIPAGRYHRVRKGQSGIAIARAYGVEWQRIVALNHLQPPFTLRADQRLLLPPAKEVAKMTLEQRAAAFRIDLTDLATGSEPAGPPTPKPALSSGGGVAKTAMPSIAQGTKPPPQSAAPARALPPTTPIAEPAEGFGGRFDWPVQGRVVGAFGPMDNGGRNDGITIAADAGATVLAAADGVVMWVGEHPAFGNVVLVRHGSGWITIYGHVDKLLVKRGQAVKLGQPLARPGSAGGDGEQAQLFFEVLNGRKPVNPAGLLPKRGAIKSDDAGAS